MAACASESWAVSASIKSLAEGSSVAAAEEVDGTGGAPSDEDAFGAELIDRVSKSSSGGRTACQLFAQVGLAAKEKGQRTQQGVVFNYGFQESVVLQEGGVPVEAAQGRRVGVLSNSRQHTVLCVRRVIGRLYRLPDPVDETDSLEKVCSDGQMRQSVHFRATREQRKRTESRSEKRQVYSVHLLVVLESFLWARELLAVKERCRGLRLVVSVCGKVVPGLVAVRLGAARAAAFSLHPSVLCVRVSV